MFRLASTVAALMSAASAASVDDSCVLVDFTAETSYFAAIDDVAKVANMDIGLFVDDPLAYGPTTLGSLSFSVLGMAFSVTPTINSLAVTGLSTANIKNTNVTGTHTFDVGASFSSLGVKASVSVELAQTSGTTDLFCLTDIANPSTCAPATIAADLALEVTSPTVFAGVEAEMYACAEGVSSSTCSNLTATSLVTTAVSDDMSGVVTAIEEKLRNVSIASLDVSFDSVSALSIGIETSSTLSTLLDSETITSAVKSVLDHVVKTVNAKSDGYQLVVALVDVVAQYAANAVIQSELVSKFGATCL